MSNETYTKILDAGIKLAIKNGYSNITREDVAKAAKVGAGTVNWHFDTMDKLKRDVMREAVATSELVIIGQGLADGNRYARRAPGKVKKQALNALMG